MSDKDPALEYVMGKVAPRPVIGGLLPVTIFQHNGASLISGSDDQLELYFSGCGTMIMLPGDRVVVVTCEHLFSTKKAGNHKCQYFVAKVLHDPQMTLQALSNARPFIPGRPGAADVAFCDVTFANHTATTPFSPLQPGGGETQYVDDFRICTGDTEDLSIQSLLSGERVALLAKFSLPGTGMYYYVTSYMSMSGESGTGFIDRKGNLFVLAGGIVDGNERLNAQLLKAGRIGKEQDAYSVVVGSFKFRL